jgi:hypothetical protein
MLIKPHNPKGNCDMFWQSNQRALARSPFLLNQLPHVAATPNHSLDWMVIETSSGLSLVIDGIPLHSSDGAEAEAERIAAESVHEGANHIHVVFGLGFGYVAKAVRQRSEGLIIIFEPHLALLKFLLTEVDYSELLNDPRIALCATVEQLGQQLDHCLAESANVDGMLDGLMTPGYAQLFAPDMVKQATEILERTLKKAHQCFRLGMAMNHTWHEVSIANVAHYPSVYPFKALEGVAKGKPALILSAGPSLQHYMHDVIHWQHAAITFAIPQALKPLQQAGITPDFIPVLDYAGAEYQLEAADTQHSRMLLGPFASPTAWQCPAQQRYMVNLINYDDLRQWTDSGTGIKNTAIGSGGSVALMATSLAIMMGCNPIVLIGQDLAFNGTQQYAGDVHITMQDGFYQREQSHISGATTNRLVTIEGQQGQTLYTSPDYKLFQEQFTELAEEMATKLPNLKLYNASVGGATLPGFKLSPLATIASENEWEPLIEKNTLFNTHHTDPLNTQGFIAPLQQTLQAAQHIMQLGGELIVGLQRWQRQLKNRGGMAERPATLDDLQSQFVETLQSQWLLYGCLGGPIWEWQNLFTQQPLSPQRISQEVECLEAIMQHTQKTFIPCIHTTLAAINTHAPHYVG